MTTIGEKVWNRLRAEGGFVHTTADGRQFVRFNRGCHPSRELIDILKRHREDLKAFVDQMHANDARRWAKATHPPGLRFFPAARPACAHWARSPHLRVQRRHEVPDFRGIGRKVEFQPPAGFCSRLSGDFSRPGGGFRRLL